jgi:tRNA A-37 threonylcarbamoyl transferase component Bud32
MAKTNIIQQGAEAIIIHEGNKIIKDRISKKYRHPDLDKKIIKARTKKEFKLLQKASSIINAPCPISSSFNEIEMPFIEGKKLSENLENLDWKSICKQIGNQIALLHDNNIIHGDLTTSNMILLDSATYKTSNNKKSNNKDIAHNKSSKKKVAEQEGATDNSKLFFIDFGLGYVSERFEDKAVDLHLIKQALEAKHFSIHKEAEKIIIENYNSKDKIKVLEQLKKVEARGRYKH